MLKAERGEEGGVRRFIPVVGVIELSTIFLSLMWLLKELGREKTGLYKAVLALFGSSFFATRIVGLNWMLYRMWGDKYFKRLGASRYMLAALSGLNAYWFVKIIRLARRQL